MINILFAAQPEQFPLYEQYLQTHLKAAGLNAKLVLGCPPHVVDYIIYAPNSSIQDLSQFTRCKAVLNLWAGVETIVGNKTLTQPLCRMVDSELQKGMTEWVTGHVLRYHLGMDKHIVNPERIWHDAQPPLAKDRPITILGLGALGAASARMLDHLGFPVTGWSRRPKNITNIHCLHGDDSLSLALQQAEILVLLLPDTPQTLNIINSDTLSQMPSGCVIINPGRGSLIDDEALLDALLTGHVASACLDVFRTEPLPKDDAYWKMPNVTVTGHVASGTRADSASRVIVQNIARGEANLPFLYLVDRQAGY